MQEKIQPNQPDNQIECDHEDSVMAFNDIVRALNVTPDAKISDLNKLKKCFPLCIESPKSLAALVNRLDNIASISVVFSDFSSEINEVLGQKNAIPSLFFSLKTDKYQVTFDALKIKGINYFPEIEAVDQFFLSFFPSKYGALYTVFKEHIRTVVKSPEDMRVLFNRFEPDLCENVCDDFREKISTYKAIDFYYALQLLDGEKFKIILKKLEKEINNVIKTSNDFKVLIAGFDSCLRKCIYDFFKGRFVEWVNNGDDLLNILMHLDVSQRQEVVGMFQGKLNQLITTPVELNNVLKYLTPETCKTVCDALKEQFKDLIKTPSDLGIALKNLFPAQSFAVCHALKDHLKDVIKTGKDCGWILADLKQEQFVVVFDVLKDHFNEVVKTGADFKDVLLMLGITQRSLVFKAFENRLSTMKVTSEEYRLVLTYLPLDEATKAYTILQERIDNIVHTIDDLKNVLKARLTDDQRDAICRALEKRLPEFFKSAKDLKEVLPLLSIETRRFVYDACKDIINVHYLKDISSLGEEQSRQIHQCWFNNIIQELPNPSGTKGQKHALELRLALQKISDKFFNENYSDDGYKVFRQECQKEVNKARPHLRGWDDFFKRLALAILTVGTAPAIMAVYSKVTRDTYSFSFFAGKEEKAIDNFMENSVIAFRTCI